MFKGKLWIPLALGAAVSVTIGEHGGGPVGVDLIINVRVSDGGAFGVTATVSTGITQFDGIVFATSSLAGCCLGAIATNHDRWH